MNGGTIIFFQELQEPHPYQVGLRMFSVNSVQHCTVQYSKTLQYSIAQFSEKI